MGLLFSVNSLYAADRFWVGGGGIWSDIAKWSTLSGGPGGASVPTSADNVFFDAGSSLPGVININVDTAYCLDMTWTSVTATLAGAVGKKLFIYGSLSISGSVITNGFTGETHFKATAPGKTITSGGFVFNGDIRFDGVGGEWTLIDLLSGVPTSCDIFLDNGSLITNDQNITCQSFSGSNINIRSLNLGNSTLTLTTSWNFSTTTNLTFIAGTSTIFFNTTFGSATFNGGSLIYNNLTATDILLITIIGSNTFNMLSVNPVTTSIDVELQTGQTQTVTDLDLVGVSDLLRVNLKSTSAPITSTISKASGVICSDWMRIRDNIAIGGAVFYAGANSINEFNNFGWIEPFSDCPPVLTTTISGVNVSCNGLCDGTATVTPIDGVPPYTYLWSDPLAQTDSTATGLCPGTYSVIVYDAVPDTAYDTIVIIEPPLLTAIITGSTNALCKDECNGTATASGSGGTPPYTYSWNTIPVQTASLATGLCADTIYIVTVTDSRGCDTTRSVVLSEPDSLLSGTPSVTNVSCKGACDGTATVTPTGGTTPYTYIWDDTWAQTTPTADSLCPGNYNVLVTDANGCTSVSSALITEPVLDLTATITGSTDPLCGSVCDGTSTVTPAGGTPPYTYSWNTVPVQTTITATGLCGNPAGIIYTVTVTDAKGCDTTATDTIFAPPPLTSSITDSTNLSCSGLCDGTATITAVGGTPLYTYSWNTTPVQTTQTATILCDSLYTGTVTDANGCITTSDVMLIAPDTLTATIVNSTNANCYGTCTGTATVRAEGGTPPYTYEWSTVPIQTDTTATGLCAGFYTVTVTDSKGCDTTDTITIIEPTVITSTTSVSCAGSCDGTATVTPVGGTPPYSYQWYDAFFDTIPGETDSILDSLCVGTYCVVTTDFNGCKDTTCIIIDLPTISLSSTNPGCTGDCNGSATVIAAGGFPPYSYIWTNVLGDTISTDSIADTLCAGWYYIKLTDSAGCVLTDSVEIIDPPVLTSIITDSTNALCNGDCNGTATVTPSGGTPPYTYSWTNGDTGSIADSLCAGSYTVTVTDSGGCDTTSTVTISEPVLLTAAITAGTDPLCGSVCDGSSTVTPAGGTSPYTYSWIPSAQTTGTATGLCGDTAGIIYTVTVTDTNGCDTTATDTIFAPLPLVLTMTVDSNVSCSGLCDGGATVSSSGGIPPYTYLWSNGDTVPSADSLCVGTYTVTVTDANGCVAIDSVSITASIILTATITGSTNPVCGGVCNGTATVTPGGGTPLYTYLWTPSAQTTALATGLCADTHYVQVTDANGCIATDTVLITEPPVLIAAITDSTNISCNGLCDGSATVTPSGGTPPYTYSWTNGDTVPTADSLCAGTYTVTVTDANSCTTTTDITITQPLVLTAAIPPVNGTCGGVCDVQAVVTPSDGTPAYAYQWYDSLFAIILGETDSILDSLCGGKYYAIVTDANGCTVTDSVTVTMPDTIILSPGIITPADCDGSCIGTATVTATGGTGLYTFSWSNGDTGSAADSLCAAIYFATVTDGNGCVDSLQVNIPAIGGLSTVISAFANVSCNGACDGSATLTTSGGAPPYTYQWYDSLLAPIPGGTDSFIGSLCPGKYYAIVTDNDSCIATSDTVTITEPGIFTSSICDSNDVSCNGLCDGFATVCPVGGVPPITYLWIPGGQTTPTVTGLCAGTYTAIVTDANGCTETDSVTIAQPDSLAIALSSTPISCNGVCDASATALVTGGTPPYIYSWTNGDTGPIADSLCAGTYTVTVNDSNGCVIIDSIIIIPLIALTADTTSTVSAGCTVCNGQATVAASGGLPPYTYSWNTVPAQTDTTATGLCASIYIATVTDANGCDTTVSVTILGAAGLTFSISIDSVISCAGLCDAQVTVTPSAGVPPYSHLWATGETVATIGSLCAGTYTDTVTDDNGCIAIAPVTITSPAIFLSSFTDSSDVICNGACDGTATVTPTGGTLPYTYNWLNDSLLPIGQTGPTATGLCPGIYNVTIDDANGCNTSNSNMSIIEPPPFAVDTISVTPSQCLPICDGQATVFATGGIAPYSYSWNTSPVQTDSTADSLCISTYTVTVTDDTGCVSTLDVLITGPSGFFSAIDTAINNTCLSNCNGEAVVFAAGGFPPYSYSWDTLGGGTIPGAIDSNITNLCADDYVAVVTDNSGCISTAPVTIIDSNIFSTAITGSTPVSCIDDSNGTATVTATGGATPYTYAWSNGDTGQTADSLYAGTHSVIVTTSDGCVADTLYVTISSSFLSAITDSTNAGCSAICNGTATVSVSGGTPPYTYLWDNPSGQTGSFADSLCLGINKVTITDTNGCSIIDSVLILSQPALAASSIVTLASCNSVNDGAVNLTVTGGTPPYIYLWSPGGDITQDLTNVFSGTYTVNITDSVGCSITDNATVPALVTVDAGPDILICFGDTATLTASVTGDSFVWSTGETDTSISVSPDTTTEYILIANTVACTDTVVVNVVVIDAGNDITIARGGGDTLSAGGSTNYLWTPSSGLSDTTISNPFASPFETTIYYVTDTNGCVDSVTVFVQESFPDGITPNGDGINDVWELDFLKDYPDVSVEIYNRWGERVFESRKGDKYANKFDGTYEGKELPVGTYYYIINLNDGSEPLTGPITVMR